MTPMDAYSRLAYLNLVSFNVRKRKRRLYVRIYLHTKVQTMRNVQLYACAFTENKQEFGDHKNFPRGL